MIITYPMNIQILNHMFDQYRKLNIWKTKLWRISALHCHNRQQILSQRLIFLPILIAIWTWLELISGRFSGWKILNVLGPSSFDGTVAFPELVEHSCPLHWFIFLWHTCTVHTVSNPDLASRSSLPHIYLSI